jgi:DNA-binding XRE family transcriptional regulator
VSSPAAATRREGPLIRSEVAQHGSLYLTPYYSAVSTWIVRAYFGGVASRIEARILKEVGACVRASRVASKMTQEDAAHRAKIDYKRWQRLERGEVNATVRTLVRVSAALGVEFWALMRRQ